MPFGFNKPSRSYAAAAVAYYDPVSGYPTPLDRAPTPSGDQYYAADSRSVTSSRSGWREPDLPPAPRRTKQKELGSPSTRSEPEREKRRKNRVSFDEEPASPTNPLRAASSVGTHKAPISKRERERRSEALQRQFADFSVLDLAPPPPKSKLGSGSQSVGSDLDASPGGSLVEVPREAERTEMRKKASKAKGKGREMAWDEEGESTGYLATEASEYDEGSTWRAQSDEGAKVKRKASKKRSSAQTESTGPRSRTPSLRATPSMPNLPSRSMTPTPVPAPASLSRRNTAKSSKPSRSLASSPVILAPPITTPIPSPSRVTHHAPPPPPQPVFPRPTLSGSTNLYNSHGELTPPSSETLVRSPSPSRSSSVSGGLSPVKRTSMHSSYAPSSPWHVMVQPELQPSRKYSAVKYEEDGEEDSSLGSGSGSGSASRSGDGSASSSRLGVGPSNGSAAGQGMGLGVPMGAREESPLRNVHPVRVERVYREDGQVSSVEGDYTPEPEHPSVFAPTIVTELDPEENDHEVYPVSPDSPHTPGLAPPILSIQPPTPQYEVEQPTLGDVQSPTEHLSQVAMQAEAMHLVNGNGAATGSGSVNGYVSPTTTVKTGESPQLGTDSPRLPTQPIMDSVATKPEPPLPPVPTSSGTSQSSSPHSSVGIASAPASVSGARASRGGVKPPMPPAPTDPDQPAFLRWDPKAQRWLPVGGLAAPARPERPESIGSSNSAYSQASAPVPVTYATPNRTRRQSLPHLSMAIAPPKPSKSPYRQLSPSPSVNLGSVNLGSRPVSPAQSVGYGGSSNSPILANGSGFPNRRMSIDPPYQLPTNTLTLLPELHETDSPVQDMHMSRPQSRRSSMYNFREDSRSRPPSVQSNRNSLAFPRSVNGGPSPASSDDGQVIREDQETSQPARPKSRSGSMFERGSMYGGSQFGDNAGPRRASSVAGREPALKTMSVRGDSVPLLGASGVDDTSRNGYTSLVLPTGAYHATSDPTKNLDKIDPRVLGMPHSTMSTITLSQSTGQLGRRTSIVSSILHPHQAPTPAHLLDDMPAPVAFSSHQAPPTKISDSQILVQVYAVALDRFDVEMVREKAATGSGSGKWVPGRAFFGRALDVGGDVRAIIKGDLVIGLVDIRKSGTLAEYIVCDRRRTSRVPYGTNLSQEEITCLPLLGVTAHRACVGVQRGSRALVLNAHEGVGSLVCQELSHLGVHVTAQVPRDVDSAEDDAWDNGAREVVCEEPVAMINEQHESGFDYVLDTVGGRRIYDASRRVIRTKGTFITLHGDDTEHVPAQTQVKSSLHALRRAFVKKDKKAISYVHLIPGGGDVDASGQDTRDILELPVMGLYRPKVGMVLPFERAPEAFEELMGLVSGRGKESSGEIVVRLNN